VKDSLLDITAQELCRLATPVVAQSERFPQRLRSIARKSLSKLYMEGRVGVGIVPDTVMADVLHLLFPPTQIPEELRPLFVTTLVDTLEVTSHPEITSWSVRLLEVVLTRCAAPVAQAFTDQNGIGIVLRAAKAGNIDSRRLQIDSLRTLCAFIASSTTTCSEKAAASLPTEAQLDLIFDSDFFDVLCSVVASRRWWLFEVSGHWMPALVQLAGIRPQEGVWKMVVKVFRDFAERNVGEEGYTETLAHLDVIMEATSSAIKHG